MTQNRSHLLNSQLAVLKGSALVAETCGEKQRAAGNGNVGWDVTMARPHGSGVCIIHQGGGRTVMIAQKKRRLTIGARTRIDPL